MWWQDFLWGFWNGLTAWAVLIAHAFNAWEQFPFFNFKRDNNWYDSASSSATDHRSSASSAGSARPERVAPADRDHPPGAGTSAAPHSCATMRRSRNSSFCTGSDIR